MYKVYGRPSCTYCDKAKELLNDRGISFTYTDITKDREAMQMFMNKGFKTVPIIYQSEDLIGGYEALYNHLSN